MEITHPQVQMMMDRAEVFVKRALMRAPGDPRLLVLAGDSGCGKTHVAWRCHEFLLRAAIVGWERKWWKNRLLISVFYPWSQLAGTSTDERDGAWRDCSESDFLVLDDVGSETDVYKSGMQKENLRLMLEERLGKFTLITMNVPPETWRAKWDARIEDRLLRRSEVIELPNVKSWWKIQSVKRKAP
jgi:DNA replication protein DnaC